MPKSMNTAELRKMDPAELHREVGEKRTAKMQLRMGLEMGSDKNAAKHREAKKEIARSLTILREKQLAGELKKTPEASTVPAPKPAARKRARKASPEA